MDGFRGEALSDTHSTTTTRPRRTGCSASSCARAISASGIRSPISKPGHPASSAAFKSRAACNFLLREIVAPQKEQANIFEYHLPDIAGVDVRGSDANANFPGGWTRVRHLADHQHFASRPLFFVPCCLHWPSLQLLRIQIQRTRRHGRLSDFNEVPVRVAHVAPQFCCVDFRLSDKFRAPRRPKVVVTPDVSHGKIQKDA